MPSDQVQLPGDPRQVLKAHRTALLTLKCFYIHFHAKCQRRIKKKRYYRGSRWELTLKKRRMLDRKSR